MGNEREANSGRRDGSAGLAAAGLAVVLLLFGGAFLYAYRQSLPRPGDLVIAQPPIGEARPEPYDGPPSASDRTPVTGSDSPGARIVVHVTGAVARSGVYQLPPGSRTVDAVEAAGGAAPGANTDALNMAAPVADGDQVVVPRRAAVSVGAPPSRSPEAYAASNAASGSQSAKLTTPGEGTVNINTASSDELQRLPGIGPAMAARILTHRKAIGRFTAVEQLMDVGGIGEKKLGHMKPFVRLR